MPSPVNAPIAINVISLLCRNLNEHNEKKSRYAVKRIVTYNARSLVSPENAPVAIDVIWLLVRYLHERDVKIAP